MEYIYILFSMIAIYAECSKDFDTRNLIKKLGLFFIIVGCFIKLSGQANELLVCGAFLYISVDTWKSLGQKIYGK